MCLWHVGKAKRLFDSSNTNTNIHQSAPRDMTSPTFKYYKIIKNELIFIHHRSHTHAQRLSRLFLNSGLSAYLLLSPMVRPVGGSVAGAGEAEGGAEQHPETQ